MVVHPAEDKLDGVAETTRQNALSSFAFFVGHVLGLRMVDDDCTCVQVSVEEGAWLHLKQPSTRHAVIAATAVALWLKVRGCKVVVTGAEAKFDGETWQWIFGQHEPEPVAQGWRVDVVADFVEVRPWQE